uniref:Probable tRNA(His) guanylyltransferase n=1 Tax=Anopheles atroparvus TaxID=41427 RepID=A0AAG5DXE3_ANOAO
MFLFALPDHAKPLVAPVGCPFVMHYCMRRLLNAVNKKIIRSYQSSAMALSRFEYVKQFEHEDKLLSNCWIVVRIDGKGFHRFCNVHKFDKPNDPDALQLMNMAGMTVMQEFNEIAVAFGQSDEYSFVFRRDASIYQRRRDKLVSYVASLFTSAYMFHWDRIFHSRSLVIRYPPSFDARAVLYPTDDNLRDYLSWRQADVHVNNLYNTTFWNLVASVQHQLQQRTDYVPKGNHSVTEDRQCVREK